jgi:hypothetical protein
VIRRTLDGDSTLAARNENVPEGIRSMIRHAASANQGAIAKPTGTQKTLATAAAKALATETAVVRAVVEQDLPRFEKALDALGAPWTPGRLLK